MVDLTFGQGTPQRDVQQEFREEQRQIEESKSEKQKCLDQGGQWDEKTQTCILIPKEVEPPKNQDVPRAIPDTPEALRDSETGRVSGVQVGERTFLGLSPEDVETIAQGEQQRKALPLGTAEFGTAQAQADQLRQGQLLASQVGQFGQLGVTPTGLNIEEGIRVGLTEAIPDAIRQAGTLAGGGAVIGGAVGTAAGPLGTGGGALLGAAIGGTTGFVSSMARSMIGSFKGQRRDTTTAQQRVLDEGKQTMADWATLARADPTNRATYLAEYNKVAAQIDQAYRQMKLDTSRDVAKFETALPNIAEFEAFYSAGGERDVLDLEMQSALQTPTPVNYNVLELADRRKVFDGNDKGKISNFGN